MGAMQRRKGHDFERLVANMYRKVWKKATIRRSLQAHQPYEPDVVLGGHPVLERFWTECQCSNDPTPLTKLDQAEGDVARWTLRLQGTYLANYRLPIVVWKRSGSRTTYVTTRMWVIRELGCFGAMPATWHDMVVTLDFPSFLTAVAALDK